MASKESKSSEKKQVAYDEKAILTLDPLAHIRLRTGMYIGRLGDGSNPDDGVYILLKEVVDNAIDEFIMGEGKKIEIKKKGDRIEVRDYGRGIPLGKVVDCVSKMHTGGKYNDDVFQFSVGLNGVGTKAVNALSSEFEVCSWRAGRFRKAQFQQGQKIEDEEGTGSKRTGTYVSFIPDPEIFGEYTWREEYIEHRLRYYSFLNTGLTIVYNDKTFRSKEGLRDLLSEELGAEESLYPMVHSAGEKVEFAFTHTNNYGETYFSFVNGQHTSDGGTHQSAFREGILRGINEFAKKSFAGSDVRDGLVGAVAVKLQDPVFESQTKNKLGSTDVRPWVVSAVQEAVEIWLHKTPEVAEKLIHKIEANEKLRKELANVKKQARERAKKTAIRIPKLTDCKIHRSDTKNPRHEETLIFLTEGDSAGGSMVQSRDVDTQAIFTLKGKPLNCYGLKRDAIYKNEELYNIMRALGIEESVDDLRYQKVVIATDADVDGMHIRNLLLTYFLRYFEELVVRGHVFVLETPLFRVRNKKETAYCYSEKERDEALGRIRGPEVTRFKGLGEISPKEMKRFVGEEIRLTPVQVRAMSEVSSSLEFFMGRNTPERRDFIVDNLIQDVV